MVHFSLCGRPNPNPNPTLVLSSCFLFLFLSVSPVFFSTGADDVSVSGLSNIPDGDGDKSQGRPIIFVGNHQLLALDLGVIVER